MVELTVSYLEMTDAPSRLPRIAPAANVCVTEEHPDVGTYLDLYRAIGGPVDWDARLKMPVQALANWLQLDTSHIHILREDGRAIGLCEFDAAEFPTVELTHFGLVPNAHGRGLGSFLLDSALRSCWALKPKKLWLHTDTNDHPNAIAVYQQAGFRRYAERLERFAD